MQIRWRDKEDGVIRHVHRSTAINDETTAFDTNSGREAESVEPIISLRRNSSAKALLVSNAFFRARNNLTSCALILLFSFVSLVKHEHFMLRNREGSSGITVIIQPLQPHQPHQPHSRDVFLTLHSQDAKISTLLRFCRGCCRSFF